MTLQSRINEAIQSALDRGMSLGEIARNAGVTASALTQWRTGSTKSLKAKSAEGIESVTGYRAAWLISGKGPKFPDAAWPFDLFTAPDYRMLDDRTRQEIEELIAGKIQRVKLTRGNGSKGRGFT
jgi:transcriptional regulator with XRE-family HTH domain